MRGPASTFTLGPQRICGSFPLGCLREPPPPLPSLTRPPLFLRVNMSPHTRGIFIVNCITFAYVVAVELFLWVRERWVKQRFSEDKRLPYAQFQVQIEQQHEHFEEFQKLRKRPQTVAGEPPDPAALAALAQMDAFAHKLAWGALLLCAGNLIASAQCVSSPFGRAWSRGGGGGGGDESACASLVSALSGRARVCTVWEGAAWAI